MPNVAKSKANARGRRVRAHQFPLSSNAWPLLFSQIYKRFIGYPLAGTMI